MALQRLFAAAAVASALFAISGVASAAVEYDFTALTAFPLDNGEVFTGSFSVTLPDFVTADIILPVASLTSCSAVSSFGPATCLDPSLLPSFESGYATVAISYNSATTSDVGIYYYFDASAFTAPGTYQTTVFGTDQAGTLVVSNTGTVPEPDNWLLMALGAAALAGGLRRVAGRSTAA
jgi:hypothetical protein